MRGIQEPDALSMVERDLSMLFVLSLFIIIFVFLGFMKIRWMEASVEEQQQEDPAQADERIVRVVFEDSPDGTVVDMEGSRYNVSALDPDTVSRLAEQAADKKVEIVLDAGMETRHWFPVTYGITKRAKAVEFSTR